MDIPELKTFVTVAKLGSFSLAAEKLFLSQPAISKRIAQLEAQLDTRLLDRIGHKVSLTEQGRTLLPRAELLLLELEDIKRAVSNLEHKVSGNLMIGASHHVGLRRLPPVLKRFCKEFPDVNLDISFVDSEQAYADVLKGELELAVVTIPKGGKSNLKTIKIWDDHLHIVVAKDHPLAAQKNVKLEDLSHFKAILPSEKTFTRSIVEETFRKRSIPISIAMNTNYIETIRMMVSIGMGWSALPESMIEKDLRILPIKDIDIHRSLGCIYHAERSLSNAARALIEILQNER